MLYDLQDFSDTYFPKNWWIVLDRNGDGCCVDFPIELRPTVKFSSKIYRRNSNGKLEEKPKTFSEVVYVTLFKKRC